MSRKTHTDFTVSVDKSQVNHFKTVARRQFYHNISKIILIKMKQFFVFISFVVVSVLAADLLTEYKKEIFNTTRQIKMVLEKGMSFDGVIRNIIYGNTPMKNMAFMFAAPGLGIKVDSENLVFTVKEILPDLKAYQIDMQIVIRRVLGVSVPREGLLSTVLGACGCPRESDDIELYWLTTLGNERTKLTQEVTRQFLARAKNPKDPFFIKEPNMMCRLKGLYESIMHPDTYITHAEVDGDKCRLSNSVNNVKIEINCMGNDND